MTASTRTTATSSLGGSRARESGERLLLMRRVAVIMFLTGGVTAAVGTVTTAGTSAARWTHASTAAGLVVCGLVLLASPARRRVIQLSVAVSIGVLGALMAGSNPIGMASLFYLWPMVYAAYFCSQRFTAVCMAWSALTLVAGLALNPHHALKVDTFVGTVTSVGLMTALVSTMTRREQRLRDELASIASTDSLTGLLNRRAFDSELAVMLDHAGRRGASLAIVMFDLDHFKAFNDRHGHLAGDDALRAMADVLRRLARGSDAIGRFGGEEFIVAMADADVVSARSYAERVAEHLATAGDASHGPLSTSAGISVSTATEAAGDLIARADEALYAAKSAGRARCAWYDGGIITL
jgi:diguanylate cyclase (GGDEF)-like protein